MRKLLTIFALACLLFLTGGYHLLYQLRLMEVKSAVKKDLGRLQKNNLTALAFSSADAANVDWENASEFRYKNKMYDVVEIETKNGQSIYWCLSDEKETALVDAYFKAQKESSQNNPSTNLAKLLFMPFVPVAPLQIAQLKQPPSAHNSRYQFFLPDCCSPVLLPPPKGC